MKTWARDYGPGTEGAVDTASSRHSSRLYGEPSFYFLVTVFAYYVLLKMYFILTHAYVGSMEMINDHSGPKRRLGPWNQSYRPL